MHISFHIHAYQTEYRYAGKDIRSILLKLLNKVDHY